MSIKQKYRWGRIETILLIQRYEDEGPSQLALDLGRSPDSVTSAAFRLGLRSLTRRQRQGATRRESAVTFKQKSQTERRRLDNATERTRKRDRQSLHP